MHKRLVQEDTEQVMNGMKIGISDNLFHIYLISLTTYVTSFDVHVSMCLLEYIKYIEF